MVSRDKNFVGMRLFVKPAQDGVQLLFRSRLRQVSGVDEDVPARER